MKKPFVAYLILILLVPSMCYAQQNMGELIAHDQIKNELIGEWTHYIPGVGSSAVFDAYDFYEDGSFEYFFYGDFLDIRDSMAGYWEVDETTGCLVAYITSVTYSSNEEFYQSYFIEPISGNVNMARTPEKTARYDGDPILFIHEPIANLQMQHTEEEIDDYWGGARLKMVSPVNSLFRNYGSWLYRTFYLPQPRNEEEERIYELEQDKYDPFLQQG